MFQVLLTAFISLVTIVTADPTWSIDKSTTATFIVGVGASHDTLAVAASADNGIGNFINQYDGSSWTKHTVKTMLLLDATVTKSGVVAAATTGKIFVSKDNGVTYTAVPDIEGISQSANRYGSDGNNLALVGSWMVKNADSQIPTTIYGVASSTDGGNTFALSSNVPIGYVRYGAFPSDQTWYISSGIWGTDPAATTGHEFSSRVALEKKGGYSLQGMEKSSFSKLRADNTTGWFGAVSKTTDGGNTWSTVFTTNLDTDYLYFNNIDCASELNCVVVAEGSDSDGNYLVKAYATFDGGVTWENTFSKNDVSLMSARFHTPEEGWIISTSKSGRTLTGNFYRTTDGGKTWDLVQSLDNCYGVDVDFGENVGFCACLSSSGSSGSIAYYK